jgi:transmembrane sensor
MNQSSRIVFLWQQFRQQKASTEEVDELLGLLQSGAYDSDSRAYLKQLLESTSPEIPDKARWEPILQNILRQPEIKQPATVRHMIPARRIAIASAAAVILLITGYNLFINHSKKESTPAQIAQTDIAPGGNKATLTLGNGSKIILDSAANGTLAHQGNSNIIKTDSGKLLYALTNIPLSPGRGAGGEGNLYNTLSTPRGGQYQLSLPDGTKVWLNAASSITYPTSFASTSRQVSITGECYFEVAKDKTKPFHVKINQTDVEVLGTHFNINAYTDEPSMNTTLLEGSVKIKTANRENILKPGQQAQVNESSGNIHITNDADLSEVVAWKDGLFKFKDASIKDIMRQLSRWYDVDVVYEGDVQNHFVTTIPRDVPVSQVFRYLETTGQVHFKIQDKKITVSP